MQYICDWKTNQEIYNPSEKHYNQETHKEQDKNLTCIYYRDEAMEKTNTWKYEENYNQEKT